ncbi:MAG: hypothetical protein U0903_04455 [Planctomycetales bacterium]
MGLGTRFIQTLKNWGGGGPVTAAEGNLQASADLLVADTLGCLLRSLRVGRTDGQTLDVNQLRTKGDELCKRLTYLLEPLRVWEVDSEGETVQARSNPPDRQQDRIRYYELQLCPPSTVELLRFEKKKDSTRTRIDMQLTYEQVEKLADDLQGVMVP